MLKMQIKELNSQGYQVIVVTSGAVGLGRQRLRYRSLLNSRFYNFLSALISYMYFLIFFFFASEYMLLLSTFSSIDLKVLIFP